MFDDSSSKKMFVLAEIKSNRNLEKHPFLFYYIFLVFYLSLNFGLQKRIPENCKYQMQLFVKPLIVVKLHLKCDKVS